MTGTTPAAWTDPGRGAELAKGQFDRGVDVVYAAAGSTGIGVLQAAKDAGKLGIGVDSNQNYMHPGNVLTSMLKRVDVAVFETAKAVAGGDAKGGIIMFDLKVDGVGYSTSGGYLDDVKDKLEAYKADIIAGKITVPTKPGA